MCSRAYLRHRSRRHHGSKSLPKPGGCGSVCWLMPGMKFSCNLCGPWVRFHPRRYSRPSASYGRGLRAGSFRDQHPAYQPDLPSVCPCTAVSQPRHGAGEDIPGCVACRRPDLAPPRNSSSNCPLRGRHNHGRSTFNRRSAPQPTTATRGYRHVRPANCGPGRVAVGEGKNRRTEMRPKNLWDPSAHIRYHVDNQRWSRTSRRLSISAGSRSPRC